MAETFEEFVGRATGGRRPYPYQQGVAELGLPEQLCVPTGAGKTMAVVLGWLYRRLFHPDLEVRGQTSRRLVFVLPMRVLAEQTVREITTWLTNLGLAKEVGCHLLLGGERLNSPWRAHPEQDMVIVGTLDMILSRALNRGYGESRATWPIDFGLFQNDCQYVFDEVQLMGPALATSRQLHGLRQAIGTAIPCQSTWMSATMSQEQLRTVDAPTIETVIELTADDRADERLARRLDAEKTIERLDVPDPKKHAATIASRALGGHRSGTLTLVVLNTVKTAREVHQQLTKAPVPEGPEIVLLHSRFRPPDRREAAGTALADVDPEGPGRIVVSTQVVEAGVDISAALLITEAARWASIVQRAGRCNRDGLQPDARVVWIEPPNPKPYTESDVTATVAALTELEGTVVTPAVLGGIDVDMVEEIQPVLRRKDLLDLFDTMPDLSGNDLDVAPFIRNAEDLDVAVAWRSFDEQPATTDPIPSRDERCPVPVGEVRGLLKEGRFTAWQYDQINGGWMACAPRDVRPGMVLLLNVDAGCYQSEMGWSPDSREVVAELATPMADVDARLDDDPVSSTTGSWVTLRQHLADTRHEATVLLDALAPPGLPDSARQAVIEAARLHDIGKAHEHFQRALRACAREGDPAAPADDVVLAKSAGTLPLRHKERPHFRHELVSALMLLGEGRAALTPDVEADLVIYLVAAHHGRVRLAIRSMLDEVANEPRSILGVHDGDTVAAVALDEGELPGAHLALSMLDGSDPEAGRTWGARALALRDRSDLGVFRLGFLETLVRLADWRASAASPSLVEEPAGA